MKRLGTGLIVVAFIFFISPLAEAQMDAQTLVKGWQAFQRMQAGQASPVQKQDASMYIGYINGIVDAASYYRSYSNHVTAQSACDVVGKYLDKYPELQHGNADLLVVEALSAAFPAFPTIKYR
jgi:hypothetical protein